jgi:hypothetical protein
MGGRSEKESILEDDPVTTTMLAKAYLLAGKEEEALSELKRHSRQAGTLARHDRCWNACI